MANATETPVLDTLAVINVASMESCELAPRELMLARIAALVAVGAPPVLPVERGNGDRRGITLEDVEGILVAVAPIVGTPRVVTAAGNLAQALGFAVAAMEDDDDLIVTNN